MSLLYQLNTQAGPKSTVLDYMSDFQTGCFALKKLINHSSRQGTKMPKLFTGSKQHLKSQLNKTMHCEKNLRSQKKMECYDPELIISELCIFVAFPPALQGCCVFVFVLFCFRKLLIGGKQMSCHLKMAMDPAASSLSALPAPRLRSCVCFYCQFCVVYFYQLVRNGQIVNISR